MSGVFEKGSPAALFAAVTAGAAMKYVAGYMFPKEKKEEFCCVGKVGAIYVYPFKSCKGLKVDSADLTAFGMKWEGFLDRHWSIATANGQWLTQRQEPSMALVEPKFEGDKITLSAPNMEPISVPADPKVTDSNLSKITVKTDTVPSIDLGDEVASWLCRYFKRDGLRLHYSSPGLEKRDSFNAKKAWEHPAKEGDMNARKNRRFSDFYPLVNIACALHDYCGYMILSNPSLDDLNKHLKNPVPITNFRANIIVDGCDPYAEDSWKNIRIGEVAQLRALDACTRCILTTVDQTQGVKDKDEEPLKTLKTYRLKDPYGEKPCFGINCTTDAPGHVKVGDPIYAKLA